MGHCATRCQMPRRCVKCAEDHGKDACRATLTRGRTLLKCALCAGKHTANFPLCVVRSREVAAIKERQNLLNMRRNGEKTEVSPQETGSSYFIRHGASQGHKQEESPQWPTLPSRAVRHRESNYDNRFASRQNPPSDVSPLGSIRSLADCQGGVVYGRKYVGGTPLSRLNSILHQEPGNDVLSSQRQNLVNQTTGSQNMTNQFPTNNNKFSWLKPNTANLAIQIKELNLGESLSFIESEIHRLFGKSISELRSWTKSYMAEKNDDQKKLQLVELFIGSYP